MRIFLYHIVSAMWAIFSSIILVILPSEASAAKFIAILAADTLEPGRTADRQATYQELLASTREFAEYAKLEYSLLDFSGNNFRISEFINAANNVSCSNDDTIFFAYVGHGTSSGVSPYPSLYFRKDQKLLQFDYVVNKLQTCQPRLLIALSGACNSWNARTDALPAPVVDLPSSPDYQLYRKLFANTRGLIKSTASSPGEVSWNTSQNIFLKSFTDTVTASLVVGQNDVSWESIMEEVKNRTFKLTKSYNPPQHPVSDVNVSYSQTSVAELTPLPFTGQLVNGKPHGYGTLTYKNGAILTGTFVNGLVNGTASYTTKDGLTLKNADYSNGVFLGLGMCNHTNATLWAAVGYSEGNDWFADGWFQVPSHSCNYIRRGELSGYFYFRLMHQSRAGASNGNATFCTFDDRAFKHLMSDDYCSYGGEPMKYDEVYFKENKGTLLQLR